MEFEKTNKVNLLLDTYGSFLTQKQKKIMDFYYKEDFSLFEISELLNVSRNAIYDTIKKSVVKLENFESKLNLLEKQKIKNSLIENIEKHDKKEIIKILEKL